MSLNALDERGSVHRRWSATPRVLRFLVVGGVNTLFGYGAYALLLFIGVHYVLATFVATIAGVLFNYFTTGSLVFKHLSRAALMRFVSVYVLTYLINVLALGLFARVGVNSYLAGLVLILPMAALSYLLMNHFVFGAHRVAH